MPPRPSGPSDPGRESARAPGGAAAPLMEVVVPLEAGRSLARVRFHARPADPVRQDPARVIEPRRN
jgi:hypothetical protein